MGNGILISKEGALLQYYSMFEGLHIDYDVLISERADNFGDVDLEVGNGKEGWLQYRNFGVKR